MTIEIRNNKILTQGGKVRQVCDPCVPCNPPDPCDEFFVPNFLDPAAVAFNPSYSFGTTLTTSATSTTSTPVSDQKVIGIPRYFRLVVEEEPTIKVTHQVSGSDVFDNLSAYNEWDTSWSLRMIQVGNIWTTLAVFSIGTSALRQINSDCSEEFFEVITRNNPEDISAQYTIRPNLIFRLSSFLNETTTVNPPVTTTDRLFTRFNEGISRSLTSCNTVFGFGFTMFCRSVAGGTGSGSCQPFPANGSANVTASVTLDIEY